MDKIIKCEACGAEIPDTSKECPECGAAVKKKIIMPKGAANLGGGTWTNRWTSLGDTNTVNFKRDK